MSPARSGARLCAALAARACRASGRSTSRRRGPRRACWRSIPARILRRPGSARWGCRSRGSGRTARRCSGGRIAGWPRGGCAMSASPSRSSSPRPLAQARDAAELIDIDYEILPSVTDTARGRRGQNPGLGRMPRQHLEPVRDRQQGGDRRRLRRGRACRQAAICHQPGLRAFHGAARRFGGVGPRRGPLHALCRRAVPAPGAAGAGDPHLQGAGEPHPGHRRRCRRRVRHQGLAVPGAPARAVRRETLRRPVRWVCDRSEAVLADEHARDNVSDAELALDADGRFLALRVKTLANVGAYISSERNLLASSAMSAR